MKYLIGHSLSLLLGLALCACSDWVGDSPSVANEVKFSIDSSRASVTTGVSISDGFGIFGVHTGEAAIASATTFNPFMYNQKVERIAEAWTYSPTKYWPMGEDDRISFFAYAPYSSGTVVGLDSSTPKMRFTLPLDAEDMVDLVCAHCKDQKRPTTPAPILFRFSHVLSKLSFSAKATVAGDDAATVKIKSITLSSTGSSGLKSIGDYDFINDTWSYPIVPDYSCTLYETGLRSISVGSSLTDVSGTNGYMMLFPSAATFTVTVDSELTLSGEEPKPNLVEGTTTIGFEKGHGHVLSLSIGDGTLSLSSI